MRNGNIACTIDFSNRRKEMLSCIIIRGPEDACSEMMDLL